MKRIFSLILAIVMLASAFPAAHASIWTGCQNCENPLTLCPDCNLDTYCPDCDICESCGYETPDNNTNDHTAGTLVVFEADSSESYTITVPAKLAPGQTGTVTLAGTWANNRVVTVTADENVTLVNGILESDTKTLKVTFDGISETGDNTKTLSFTEDVAVANISNALFGTWSGKFNYNVSVADAVQLISFTIDGTSYQAEEGMTWAEWIVSDYNTTGLTADEMTIRDINHNEVDTSTAIQDGASYSLYEEVPTERVAGLYKSGTNFTELICTWDEMVENGAINTSDGYLYNVDLYYVDSVFNKDVSVDLIISDTVTKLGCQCFDSATALETVVVPSSVTTIDDCIFVLCEKVILLPVNISEIACIAFGDGFNDITTDIYYAGSEAQWKNNVSVRCMCIDFDGDRSCNYNGLYIPENATIHYNYTFE